jgi:hypothetical protein
MMLSKAANSAAPATMAGAILTMVNHDAAAFFPPIASRYPGSAAGGSRARAIPGMPSKNTAPQIKKA